MSRSARLNRVARAAIGGAIYATAAAALLSRLA